MQEICSKKVLQIPHSGIRHTFNLALEYADAIHLCIGEPDFSTPSFIIEAAYEAAKNGLTHYTINAGILKLREAISKKYQKEQGIFYDPKEEILVTVGAMEALALTMMVILNPGDEIILSNPSWPNYDAHILLGDGKPVFVPVKEEEGWVMTADRISDHLTSRTKAILINSPNNPTGAVYNLKQLEEIAKISLDRDIIVISDEAYEKIIYEERHHSIASFPEMKERTIVINTFSKSYAMTGWRIGYALGNKKIIKEMTKLQEHIAACASSISQAAALAALQKGSSAVVKMVGEYKLRRSLLLEEIEKTPGFSCLPPKGTFYAFVNIKKLGENSSEVSLKLLKETRVVTVPGSAFGSGGEGYLRISFATSCEKIKLAFKRIRVALKNWQLFLIALYLGGSLYSMKFVKLLDFDL